MPQWQVVRFGIGLGGLVAGPLLWTLAVIQGYDHRANSRWQGLMIATFVVIGSGRRWFNERLVLGRTFVDRRPVAAVVVYMVMAVLGSIAVAVQASTGEVGPRALGILFGAVAGLVGGLIVYRVPSPVPHHSDATFVIAVLVAVGIAVAPHILT